MPDITMCRGEGCPMKDRCWRHTAPPTPLRQSYFASPPYDPEKDECEYFWNTEPRRDGKSDDN